MFKISNNTLFIEFNGEKTLIKEDDADLVFNGDLTNSILNISCIYYGSSLNGRIKGSRSILGSYYKLPIIISEKNRIIFFPVKNDKNVLWINFNNIGGYENKKNGMLIIFKNGYKKYLKISSTVFNNQLLKCSRLWLVYLTRE